MKNDRFEILGTMGGEILTTDPCQHFSQAEAMCNEMDRGLRASLARSDKEWSLGEPVKSATNQIDMDALSHFLTEPRSKVKEQIIAAFGPSFDQGVSPDGPSLATRPANR